MLTRVEGIRETDGVDAVLISKEVHHGSEDISLRRHFAVV